MNTADYPSAYRAADKASAAKQRFHFALMRMEIYLLLVTAGISSVAWAAFPMARTGAFIALAITLVASIGVGLLRNRKRYDRRWFSNRALAESLKVEAWRFMMRADPYPANVPETESEARFLINVKEILKSISEDTRGSLGAYMDGAPQVTAFMRRLRASPLQDRLQTYRRDRLEDQRHWYASRSKINEEKDDQWSVAGLIMQLVAVGSAMVIVAAGDFVLNPVGVLTTIAAGGQAWSNAKSYGELSQSYGLIAEDLALLVSWAENISKEEDLNSLVLDVERTISREHTLWRARRLR